MCSVGVENVKMKIIRQSGSAIDTWHHLTGRCKNLREGDVQDAFRKALTSISKLWADENLPPVERAI